MSLEFYSHKEPVARKEHICEMCGQKIMVGRRYSRDVGKYDGDFFTRDLHLDCLQVLLDYLSEEEVNEFTYPDIAYWWRTTRCSDCKHHYPPCGSMCKFRKGDTVSCGDYKNGKCTAEEPCDEMTRSYWCDKYEENKG